MHMPTKESVFHHHWLDTGNSSGGRQRGTRMTGDQNVQGNLFQCAGRIHEGKFHTEKDTNCKISGTGEQSYPLVMKNHSQERRGELASGNEGPFSGVAGRACILHAMKDHSQE